MRRWLFVLLIPVLMISVASAQTSTPAPTLTPSPGITPTLVPSATPSLMLTAIPSPDEAFSETLQMGRGSILHAEWHLDGQRFLVDTVRGAWLYSVDETSGRFVDEAHIETARTARFSPDGSLIAGINEDQAVTLWNATTYSPITTLSAHNAFVRSLVWHPIENLLATLDQTGRIIVWDSANSEQSIEFYLNGADQITWSPGGAYLAAVDRERSAVNVWDATGEPVLLFYRALTILMGSM
ncbi:hypothetical protein HC928_06675 [bacterium]|nr:hypothetical protein [bacterium]